MLNLKAALLALGLAISQVNAHFLLLSPTSAGFDDNKEDVNPCGGFVPNFDNSTDFFVDGDSIAVQSTHPVANWLFRATLDDAAAGNWTNLVPSILQNGVGDFCKTDVTVPASYAGQQGVIQIIQEATDGALYQCAAVNFKAGSASSKPNNCANATTSGWSVTFAANNDAFSTVASSILPAATGSPSSATSGSTASKTSAAAAASSSSAAMAMAQSGTVGVTSAVVVLGAALFALVL